MQFSLKCTNLSIFDRRPELTATPSPTRDIRYMSVGVMEKLPIVLDCPEATTGPASPLLYWWLLY